MNANIRRTTTRLIILIGLLLSGMIMSSFAQIKEVPKTIPEGKWELKMESLHAVVSGCMYGVPDGVGGGHLHKPDKDIDIKDIDTVFYTELEVKQDSIIFISSENILRTKYVYTNRRGILYDSPSVPFLSGGNVYGNNLYVQQRIDNHSFDSTQPMFISFIYEYKEKE